jgi:hypothetical protein
MTSDGSSDVVYMLECAFSGVTILLLNMCMRIFGQNFETLPPPPEWTFQAKMEMMNNL